MSQEDKEFYTTIEKIKQLFVANESYRDTSPQYVCQIEKLRSKKIGMYFRTGQKKKTSLITTLEDDTSGAIW